MRIKPDWTEYLHAIRRQQFGVVFGRCGAGVFPQALELGAGDGFLSTLLRPLCGRLTATDLNARRLPGGESGNVTFRVCDAEALAEQFPENHFDLVFSSSLLEHLNDCPRALAGIARVLTDDGLAVHYLPNRLWKVVTILLHWPNKIVKALDKMLGGRRSVRHQARSPAQECEHNNLKTPRRRRNLLARLFLPRIHGVSRTTLGELAVFGRRRWIARFGQAGFVVLAVYKAGFNSGYGFGWHRLRRLLERAGLHTSFAYVLAKRGMSPAAANLLGRLHAGVRCHRALGARML
ncbi:MAG: class I SAM-dependent methyltransferase [Planctomycetota bacterium]|nr:class I SAM-dependent methyltransferase [Planctomycetota bacterium]